MQNERPEGYNADTVFALLQQGKAVPDDHLAYWIEHDNPARALPQGADWSGARVLLFGRGEVSVTDAYLPQPASFESAMLLLEPGIGARKIGVQPPARPLNSAIYPVDGSVALVFEKAAAIDIVVEHLLRLRAALVERDGEPDPPLVSIEQHELYEKYRQGGERSVRYFVLDLHHDAHARKALRTYWRSLDRFDDEPLLKAEVGRLLRLHPVQPGDNLDYDALLKDESGWIICNICKHQLGFVADGRKTWPCTCGYTYSVDLDLRVHRHAPVEPTTEN